MMEAQVVTGVPSATVYQGCWQTGLGSWMMQKDLAGNDEVRSRDQAGSPGCYMKGTVPVLCPLWKRAWQGLSETAGGLRERAFWGQGWKPHVGHQLQEKRRWL